MGEEIEIEFEDSIRRIKFRLKGPQSLVDNYIDRLGGFDFLQKSFAGNTNAITQNKVNQSVENLMANEELPEKPEANSLSEYVLKLIYSDWAKLGRTSTEILDLARIHAVPIQRTSLSGILNALQKSRKVYRFKSPEDQQYKYSAPFSVRNQK